MALKMIEDAEKDGRLKPGGTIIEGTSGNTGMGLAIAAVIKGYKCIFTTTDKQSKEKVDALRAFGAEVVVCPTDVDPEDPRSYYSVSSRLVNEIPNAWKPNQYDNPSNAVAHYEQTGPEIWEQTNGKIDAFICSIGTGGTIAGTSTFLREKKNDIIIGVADPRGAAMYNYFAHGEVKASDGGSITEGIGLGRVTPIIEDIKVDKAYLIPDEEAVPIIFDLIVYEGLCLGGSSGINVAGAIRLAKEMGPGHTIVTVLADSGARYQSKLFNPEFLRSKNLPVPAWLERRTDIKPPFA
jgi:cysteine synthase A